MLQYNSHSCLALAGISSELLTVMSSIISGYFI